LPRLFGFLHFSFSFTNQEETGRNVKAMGMAMAMVSFLLA